MPQVPQQQPRIPFRAWYILALAGMAGMMYYLDRQTLSVLKTTLKGVFGWSDIEYGWLTAIFMVPYTIGYFFAGRLIDRFGTRVMMPVFLCTMSAVTLLTASSSQLWQFAACRMALGFAGAGVVPMVMVTIVTWFPHDRRGTANMFSKPFSSAGNILVTPLAVSLATAFGWRWAFIVPGLTGVALALMWIMADRNPPQYTAPAATSPVASASSSLASLLRNRTLWGLILARAISDPLWFFLMFWQPGYLQEELDMSFAKLGWVGWIPFAVSLVMNMVLSRFSDVLIDRGWTPQKGRLRLLQLTACLSPAMIIMPFVTSHAGVIAILCVVQAMALVWFNLTNLLMADVMPRHQVGTCVGIINACGAGTGALVNFTAGWLLAQFGYPALFIAGALLHPLAAGVLWWFYQRRPGSAAVQ
ncbi:MFS transporter [Ereboglobus luteus]|uniref:Major facilitator superfamily (MFS) profile domain-containing protein n=1 Tax=Ereboglobus luteus TaxID=1796921 RepID=A0A2U8E575_9BACT|nr:MFS transporter [Ereboglobus luteus]AWI09704.1 hypothetical protein CKA38_10975 [Ereboglobus luteus]